MNPFRYGDVAIGQFFTDRHAELHDLRADMRSGQNVLLLSPRRYGKTSLITEVIRQLQKDKEVLVAYADLLRATTKAELAGLLATALYRGLVPPVEQAVHRLGEFFGNLPLRPKLTLPTGMDGSVTPSFEFGVAATAEDTDATLDQLLGLPGEMAKKRQRRVALVLDEFQAILELDPHMPQRMRAVFQFQPDVSHVYSGSKQHLLQRVFTDANAPLYNSAKVFPVGPIPVDRFALFIKERFAATVVQIEDDAVDHILAITGGHPHDTQKLCHFVWNLAEVTGARASVDLVDEALRQVLSTDTARYTEIWESLTPNQRRVLEVVARTGPTENILSQRFRDQHGLKAYRVVDYALEKLVERSLVERVEREHFVVPDVFLARWLRSP